jgi:aspartate-semialdehyde dehydrogenase
MIKAAVAGASGIIGEHMVLHLARHPFFEVVAYGSSRTEPLKDRWMLPQVVDGLNDIELRPYSIQELADLGVRVVFSALSSPFAEKYELEAVSAGMHVISNSSPFRLDPEIPLIIPEVNKGIVDKYTSKLIKNPNCTTTGVAIAIKALMNYGIDIKEIYLTTYQSLSGDSSLTAYNSFGNVIPYISGEEEKIVKELKKMTGIEIPVNVHAARVNVSAGHMESLFIKTGKVYSKEEVIAALENLQPVRDLPSSPSRVIKIFYEKDRPQPILDSWIDQKDRIPGMTVSAGRINVEQNVIGMFILVNNLIRGGAGGSILNGELLHYRNILR